MKRREFITQLSATAAAWPLSVRAQQNGSMRRVGVLMNLTADNSDGQTRIAALSRALKELGWSVGQNIRLHLFGGKTSVRRQLVDDVGRLLAKVVRRLVWSGAEDETRPGIGAQELIGYLGLGHLVERLTSAVQWNDIVDVHFLDRCDRVAHVVFLIGCKVEATDNRVNFIDTRSRLGLFDRVDHSAMRTRGQYD